MKRISIAAGVVLVVALAITAVSYLIPHDAGAVSDREYRVKWIKTQVPVLPDSDMILRDGSNVASAQRIDTTAWIPLWDGLELHPSDVPGSVVDTVSTYFDFFAQSGITGAATIAVDTVVISIQASIDGTKPVAVTRTFNAPYIETSSNDAVFQKICIGKATPANGTAPSNTTLGPYRFIRFIVTGDYAGPMVGIWKYPGNTKSSSALSP